MVIVLVMAIDAADVVVYVSHRRMLFTIKSGIKLERFAVVFCRALIVTLLFAKASAVVIECGERRIVFAIEPLLYFILSLITCSVSLSDAM